MKKIKILLPIALLVVLVAVGLQLQAKATRSKIPGAKVESQNQNKIPAPASQITWPAQSNYSYFPPAQFADDTDNPDVKSLLAQIPPEVLASMPLPLDKKIRVASIKEVMNSFRRSIPRDISPAEREKIEANIEQMEAQALDTAHQLRVNGYVKVDQDEIADFEKVKAEAKSMDKLPETTFNPSNLSSLETQGLKFEGARALHQEGEPAILLTRIFKTTTGGEVHLYEGERQGATLQKEMVNENINGQPAIYVVKKSSDGKELKELICFSDKKMYELKTNDVGVDLVTIARSIRD